MKSNSAIYINRTLPSKSETCCDNDAVYYKRIAIGIVRTTIIEYINFLSRIKKNQRNNQEILAKKKYYEDWFNGSWFETLTMGKINPQRLIKDIHILVEKNKAEKLKQRIKKSTRFKQVKIDKNIA